MTWGSVMRGLHPGHARVRGNSYKDYRETLRRAETNMPCRITDDAVTYAIKKRELGYLGDSFFQP